MSDTELSAYLDERRSLVDAALERALPSTAHDGRPDGHRNGDPGRVREGMRYAVLDGGKRMRPCMVVAACEAAGGSAQQALSAGCALEMVHAYSLVHDDLPAMDDDTERRGRPTAHVAFGESMAILIGDALLTRAFEVLADPDAGLSRYQTAEGVAVLAHYAGIDGMVGGQAMDMSFGQDIDDLQRLEAVHARKTGGLYAAAGALGAIAAGADKATVEALERYGMAWGVAFQHADDALDDEQPALREQALGRVDTLTGECRGIAEGFGDRGSVLASLADWVASRARRAAGGERLA